VHKNVGIKAIEGSVPLLGKIRVVANVLPVTVAEPEAIVGVDYRGFTMRAEQFSRIAACCFLPGQLKIRACTRIIPPQELLCRGSYQVSKLQQYGIFLYGGRFEIVAGNGFEWTEVNFYSHSDGGGFSVLSSAP
jgi:hypothetical protein